MIYNLPFFGQVSISLNDLEQPFVPEETIAFKIISLQEFAQEKKIPKILIDCEVLKTQYPESKEHVGKHYTMQLSLNDNEVSIRFKSQFVFAVYNKEELEANEKLDPSSAIGRMFTAKIKYTEYNGNIYQNWQSFSKFVPGKDSSFDDFGKTPQKSLKVPPKKSIKTPEISFDTPVTQGSMSDDIPF